MKLAVIPARGGSKRIPRKNIKDFCGKPIIAWSIEAALQSECFDAVVVSTDDPEIADVAKRWGAQVPFLRPTTLADDHTGTSPVIRHAIEWFGQQGKLPTHVCCIYATAPFVRPDDLRRGFELLIAKGGDYALAVTSYPFPIQRAIRVKRDGYLEMFQSEYFSTRSQDLELAWHDAGQFCWGRSVAWSEEKSIFSSVSLPVELPRHRVQDIDTYDDWTRAEWMFKAMHIQT